MLRCGHSLLHGICLELVAIDAGGCRRNSEETVLKKIVLFGLAIAAVAGAAPAKAADLAVPPYTKAPVAVVQTNSWAGIYLGGQVGFDFTSTKYDLTNAGVTETFLPNTNSAAGGGHLGIQGQWANWVLGVEGNYNWASLKETDPSVLTVGRSSSISVDGIATVVGKVGYAFGDWLVFGKGGWADARINTAITTPAAGVTQWQSGWTVGGGLDYKIARNWIVGAEADFYSIKFDRSGVASDSSTVTWSNSSAPIYAIMFHLSYLFNTASPVVARY